MRGACMLLANVCVFYHNKSLFRSFAVIRSVLAIASDFARPKSILGRFGMLMNIPFWHGASRCPIQIMCRPSQSHIAWCIFADLRKVLMAVSNTYRSLTIASIFIRMR